MPTPWCDFFWQRHGQTIPFRIHQNTPFQMKKKSFSGEEPGLSQTPPFVAKVPLQHPTAPPAKPLESVPSSLRIRSRFTPLDPTKLTNLWPVLHPIQPTDISVLYEKATHRYRYTSGTSDAQKWTRSEESTLKMPKRVRLWLLSDLCINTVLFTCPTQSSPTHQQREELHQTGPSP